MAFYGSPNWTWTSDTLINSQVLYRLSYGGILDFCSVGWTTWAMEKYNWNQEEQTKQKCWRRPIFPGRFQPSIFGAGELNFCVRNGNRWTLTVKITNYSAYACKRTICSFDVGIDLSSQSVARQVFSALVSLTSVFGMGTGGPSPPLAPTFLLRLSPSLYKTGCPVLCHFIHFFLNWWPVRDSNSCCRRERPES